MTAPKNASVPSAASGLTDEQTGLPDVFIRSLERAIAEAENPSGMSAHDGKARIDSSHLRRVLATIRALQAEQGSLRKHIDRMASRSPEPALVAAAERETKYLKAYELLEADRDAWKARAEAAEKDAGR
jgi:hypothetical protein